MYRIVYNLSIHIMYTQSSSIYSLILCTTSLFCAVSCVILLVQRGPYLTSLCLVDGHICCFYIYLYILVLTSHYLSRFISSYNLCIVQYFYRRGRNCKMYSVSPSGINKVFLILILLLWCWPRCFHYSGNTTTFFSYAIEQSWTLTVLSFSSCLTVNQSQIVCVSNKAMSDTRSDSDYIFLNTTSVVSVFIYNRAVY